MPCQTHLINHWWAAQHIQHAAWGALAEHVTRDKVPKAHDGAVREVELEDPFIEAQKEIRNPREALSGQRKYEYMVKQKWRLVSHEQPRKNLAHRVVGI